MAPWGAALALESARRFRIESSEAPSVVIDLTAWRRRDEAAAMADDDRNGETPDDSGFKLRPNTGNFTEMARKLQALQDERAREREEADRMRAELADLKSRQDQDEADRAKRRAEEEERAKREAIEAELLARLKAEGKVVEGASMPDLPAIQPPQREAAPSQWAIDLGHLGKTLPRPAIIFLSIAVLIWVAVKYGLL